MKGVIEIEPMIYRNVPKFKTRSEFETEKLLHKYRVLARREQIKMTMLDSEYPFEPGSLSTFTNPKRREHFLRVIWSIIKYGLIQLRP